MFKDIRFLSFARKYKSKPDIEFSLKGKFG